MHALITYTRVYIYLIAWVSGQYGEILHESCKGFSRSKGEGKYCTRVQCLAILTANPCNEEFTTNFSNHWRLTTSSYIIQRTSELIHKPGRYPRVDIVSNNTNKDSSCSLHFSTSCLATKKSCLHNLSPCRIHTVTLAAPCQL